MEIFSKLLKGAEEAGEKAKVIIEINKVRIQISQKQKEIDDIFKKIGETVFSMYEHSDIENILENVEESCQECIKKQKEVKELEQKIRELSNEKHCPQCDKIEGQDTKFCSSCGYKFEIQEVMDKKEEQEDILEIKQCLKCSANNEAEAKFCGNCGEEIQ